MTAVMRQCTVCGEEKQLTNFPRNGKDRDGNARYRTDCKTCYGITRKLTKKKAVTKFINNDKVRMGKKSEYTLQDWKDAMVFFKGSCSYCGRPQKRGLKLTREHVVPVSAGGPTTRENIVPACGKCNSSKGDKPLVNWFKKQPFFDDERLQRLIGWCKINGFE